MKLRVVFPVAATLFLLLSTVPAHADISVYIDVDYWVEWNDEYVAFTECTPNYTYGEAAYYDIKPYGWLMDVTYSQPTLVSHGPTTNLQGWAEPGHTYWGYFEVTLELYFYDVTYELYYDVYGYTNYETMEFEIYYYWASLYAVYYEYMEEVLGYGEDSVTVPPRVRISAAQEIDDGQPASFWVEVQGASPTGYGWSYQFPSGSGNNPTVNFNPQDQDQTSAEGKWFAKPDQDCPATNCQSTYTIKCTVSFSNFAPITKQTQLKVNACWEPAGQVNYGLGRIIGVPYVAPDAGGVWRVVGMGTFARQIPTEENGGKVFNVPSVSQFFGKADAHEQDHVDQLSQGKLLGGVHQPADFYARIQSFTGTSEDDLMNKIIAAFQTYSREQAAFIESKHNELEKLAYGVSDLIDPKYLYQNCGRYK